MKRCFVLSLLCIVFVVWVSARRLPAPGPEAASAAERLDERETICLLSGGEVREMTLAEYLPGVVAAEMPASFAPEALRAQAVAARTYTLYQKRTGRGCHPQADICADPGCCQAFLGPEERADRWGEQSGFWEETVCRAVLDTDGTILTWNKEPILACFHAASPGRTESSGALWGRALPYLVSVSSPETAADVPGFVTTTEISAAEMRETIRKLCPEAKLDAPAENWLGERVLDAAGRVDTLRIGGEAIPGERLRAAFSLRSAAFTLEYDGKGFRFTVTGNGHGVGMSQYGADVLARRGFTWREILSHYYPGAALSALSPASGAVRLEAPDGE